MGVCTSGRRIEAVRPYLLYAIEVYTNSVEGVLFSPNSKLVACTAREDSQVMTYGNKSRTNMLEGHTDNVDAVLLSPSGEPAASRS